MAHKQLQIKTLQALGRAANHRRSVICPAFRGLRRPKPAKFVLQMTGEMILRMLDKGLFLYEKRGGGRS